MTRNIAQQRARSSQYPQKREVLMHIIDASVAFLVLSLTLLPIAVLVAMKGLDARREAF